MLEQKTRWGGIMVALCEVIVGVLLLIRPVAFTVGIVTALGILLLCVGILNVVSYFKSSPEEAKLKQSLARGLISILLGLFLIFKKKWLIAAFPLITMVYGVVTLVTGIVKIQWMADMIRQKAKRWVWVGLSAGLTIIGSIVILCNPFSSTVILWSFIAITLIVEAVIDLVAAIFSR